ncbi:MAG: acyltransferase family protein [Opitutaceae bacterium]
MKSKSANSRNFGLDLLRCLAIGGVLFGHGQYFLYPYVPPIPVGFGRNLHLYHFGQAGAMGVELFFVLSGFLIGGLLLRIGADLRHRSELLRFYVRRWFRTLPNYYVFLALNVVCFAPLALAPPFLPFLQNFAGNHVTFFPESWSLGVEEWFYLLFPFVTWVLLRRGRSFDAAFLTAGFGLYGVSTILRMAYACNPANGWGVIRIVTVLRFDALMTGILAAWLAARRPTLFSRHCALKALVGVALLFFCYATFYWNHAHNESFFAHTFRFNLISLGYALLLPLATSLHGSGSWLGALIERLARWSYAMYFINLPLFYFIVHVVFTHTQTSAFEGWFGFATMEVGTILLAGLWYSLFERPTTALRERYHPRRRLNPPPLLKIDPPALG